MTAVLITSLVISIIAIIFAVYLAINIKKKNAGNEKMQEIAESIHHGAMAFLHKEYRILIVFMVVVAVILYFLIGQKIAIAFVLGAIFSALAGNIGMRIATQANVRTAQASKKSINSP